MAVVGERAPPLDLSSINQEEELGLIKETSTVGDLISFTDRRISPVRQVRRRHSFGEIEQNKQPIRRQSSLKSLTDRRSPVKSRSRKNSRSFTERFSPEKSSISPLDEPNTSRRRQTNRRESMINFLRDDLSKIPCLTALQRFPSVRSDNAEIDDGVFDTSESDDERYSPRRKTRGRRSSSFNRKDSMRSFSDSSDSFGILTESELRKLRMIETLNKMNGKKSQRQSIDSEFGELAILEASYGKGGKRKSIATRVLMKTQKKKTKDPQAIIKSKEFVLGKTSPTKRPESELLREEQQEKAQKFFNIFKKADRSGATSAADSDTETANKPDPAKDALMSFRRRVRRKKRKPIDVFRKKAKFLVLLLRAWKIHSNAINESLVANNESLDMITRATDADLLFDITAFKAAKEAKVSQEVRRILTKKPKTRTEDEEVYIQIFLRNYKNIAEYPVKMQRLIAQRSWIESYDVKRVVVREGHVPMCFYFILSGSAIVSTMQEGIAKTVMFLNRGDSFGDLAILNNARRETTVISREKIELLCMTDEDFVDIFMSGGLRDPDDPFLKSINFLDGWPRERLIDNPKKCIFSYFKRGTILVSDSTNNDWIFVVKSGSASVLKKLHAVNTKKKRKKKKVLDFRDEVLQVMRVDNYLSHAEKVELMFEEEKRSLEGLNLHVRYYALPEINVETNESYNELKQMKEEFMNANSVNRALVSLEKSGVDIVSEAGNSDTSQQAASLRKAQQTRRKSIANVVLKGPFKTAAPGMGRELSFASLVSSRREVDSRQSHRSVTSVQKSVRFADSIDPNQNTETRDKHFEPIENQSDPDNIKKVNDWEQVSLPSLGESPLNDLTNRPPEALPVFVEIQTLTKGQVFGLTDMIFENQPQFSLVSNGAECIMIEKKFYQEFSSQQLFIKIRDETYPYPSDEKLQENLESQIRWDADKKLTLSKVLRENARKRKDPNDARGTLKLPPIDTLHGKNMKLYSKK
ncbi:hypothetical protein ACF0H5_014223 [Mactra antiquata]